MGIIVYVQGCRGFGMYPALYVYCGRGLATVATMRGNSMTYGEAARVRWGAGLYRSWLAGWQDAEGGASWLPVTRRGRQSQAYDDGKRARQSVSAAECNSLI